MDIRALLTLAALGLSGCGGGTLEKAEEPRRQELNIPTRGTTSEFTTAKTVEPRTSADIMAALTLGNATIRVPAGDYTIGRTEIGPNTVLMLQPGVTLRDSGQLTAVQQLLSIRGENVRIVGHGARVIAKRSDYTSGEFRHGVLIFGARNISIEGLESSGHGGDGYYIGGPSGFPAEDISIIGCAADNNRRQGMSIVNAARVFIADCEFSGTAGARPEFGIDLEPNSPMDVLHDIAIVRPQTTSNRGGGITIGLSAFGPGARASTIDIYEHTSVGEQIRFQAFNLRPGLDVVKVDGKQYN